MWSGAAVNDVSTLGVAACGAAGEDDVEEVGDGTSDEAADGEVDGSAP